MTNSEIIAAVVRWQTDSRLHPLTCGNHDQDSEPLIPIENGGRVILQCPKCAFRQAAIPDAVLEWNGNLLWFLGLEVMH
jgi:hypothetical protein